MKIAEIFYSVQGEGKLLGVPSVFVRVSGCNLRCVWCDTPYASWAPEGDEMAVEAVVEGVANHGARHVVLTGGEPMLFKEVVPLIRRLKEAGKHVTLETAGTLWQDGLSAGDVDLASVSPKLGNSVPRTAEGGRLAQMHDRQRENLEVLERFATESVVRKRQWKFVIAEPEDVTEAEGLLARLNMRLPAASRVPVEDIVLMPEGIDAGVLAERSMWLAEICKKKGYRLSPRLHVQLWGNRRGT